MKKQFIYLFISILVFSSCEQNIIGDFDNSESLVYVDDTEDAVNKRGVAYTNKSIRWSHKTSEMGAHWMYSWGNALRDEIPENVEYIPMFWGKGSVNDEVINRLKQLKDEGKIKYILGFNEPDGAAQANMTVDEAIALWPRLEEVGLPIGSPATVSPNNEWMVEFMEKAEAQNLRVDFVTVHSYGGPNALAFINKLKETYRAYNKPIWITEFAVADWNATTPENNKHSEAVVMDYMKEVLTYLDDIDYIHRYAWFDGAGRAPLASSALSNEEGMLTPLGQLYGSFNPNPIVGPGQDTEFVPVIDPDELLANGSFETGDTSSWGGFKNGVAQSPAVEPVTGNFAGKLEGNDASLFTVAEVTPGKTYVIKYQTKWIETIPNTFSPVLRNDEVSGSAGLLERLPDVSMTDQWAETTYEFVVPDGVTKLRIVFFKGKVTPTFPTFFIDDVSIKEK